MPSIVTKSGLRRWRASVMVQGKVRQKLFPDDSKASARAAAAWEAETQKKMASATETATVSWTVLDWLNANLDSVSARVVPKTKKEKAWTFQRVIRLLQPEALVADITTAMALKILETRALVSGYAANKDRKNLVTAWNWGLKYLPDFPVGPNPFYAVERFPETRSPRYVPPEEDFWKVYAVAEGQDKVMLLTFLHLGARRTEVFKMKWTDVSFPDSRIRLWTRKRRGGNEESDWLPMTTELRAALATWWEQRPVKNEHVFVCLDRTAFCEEYYGKPFTSRQHLMDRLCLKAGVKPFGFHAIRHLTASILYHSGQPTALIQSVLRHKSPQTTAGYLQTLGLEHTRQGLEDVMVKRGPAKVIELKKAPSGQAEG